MRNTGSKAITMELGDVAEELELESKMLLGLWYSIMKTGKKSGGTSSKQNSTNSVVCKPQPPTAHS